MQIFKSLINNTRLSSTYFGHVKNDVGQVKIINYLPGMASSENYVIACSSKSIKKQLTQKD